MQRPSRFLDRQGKVAAEKRGLDPDELEEQQQQQPEQKRQKVPALASVIVEALKVDSLQKLCSSLEPVLRRVVSEEVERALAKLGPARIGARSSPKRIEGPDGRNLQLHFRSRPSLPLFTGGKVEGEQGAAIHVVLLDASTGHVVTSGPESFSKLDVVVLEGDFNNEDDDGWTEEEFESHVVKEREGKRPILTGDLQVSLKEGVGTLGELMFTDNSSWIRSRKFRLGLKIASGFCEGIRIREAKTEAFVVKDHRGELYKKHYPPAQNDEVWRLEKIGKDGSFHKRLNKAGIYTVEDFLRLVVRDSPKLRSILGSGMSNKMWESLVEHAKTCVLSGKLYIYYSDDMRNVGAIFNNIYEFSGLIAGGQYISADALSDSQKVFVDSLVKKAYDNWTHVVEYDGKVLLSSKESKGMPTSMPEAAMGSVNYPSYNQVSLPLLPSSVSSEHTLLDSRLAPTDTGFDKQATSNLTHLHVSPDAQLQHGSTLYPQQDQFLSSSNPPLITRNDSTGLALGPPQRTNLDFQQVDMSAQPSNINSYGDWLHQRDNQVVDDFFPEEEIRMRSHEMLENDDMQQLLRVFSGASNSLAEDSYAFPSFMPTPSPNYNFDVERGRSGKAVVGWLKIKAAMRWGIFIRKKAAERRARQPQLVELDD